MISGIAAEDVKLEQDQIANAFKFILDRSGLVDETAQVISNKYRLGNPRNGKSLWKVSLSRKDYRKKILRNAKFLKDNVSFKGIYINADTPPLSRKENGRLRSNLLEFRNGNPTKVVKLVKGKLVMNKFVDKFDNQASNSSGTTFSLYLCNARSVLPKIDFIRTECLEHSPTILACTETWLHSLIGDNLLNVPNYNIVRHDRESRGGGVMVYVSMSVKYSFLNLNVVTPNFMECIWIYVYSINAVFVTVYIPPIACKNAEFCTEINNYFESNFDHFCTSYSNPHLALCGDFNTFNCEELNNLYNLL